MTFKKKYGDLSGKTYSELLDGSSLGLTSLDGCPKIVDGACWLNSNKLSDLTGSPEEVTMTLYLQNNKLVSLEGNLKRVQGDLNIMGNNFPSKDFIMDELLKNNIVVVGNIQTDYGTITPQMMKTRVNVNRMGKFKDLLDI